MSTTQSEKHALFKSMHERPGVFVIPNPWNAGTARILTALGFEALATTSAGFAFSLGRRDSAAALTRDEVLANAREIVDATHLPVSADLEDGYGSAPEACAETVRLATAAGLVGGSIEDATGDAENPIFEFNHAVERVAAACEAARELPFVLTARAENFLHGRPDLDDTIRRLQAFEKVGRRSRLCPRPAEPRGDPNAVRVRRKARQRGHGPQAASLLGGGTAGGGCQENQCRGGLRQSRSWCIRAGCAGSEGERHVHLLDRGDHRCRSQSVHGQPRTRATTR
jgi:hypothetical protein